jgi:putative ABC transport system ATP-binding protein
MNNMIIQTQNVSKTYTSGTITNHALRYVTLGIPKGSFTCIVGPSGHGKSTLMHLFGGLDRPTEGSVFFQFFNLMQSLTSKENIETAMMLAGIPKKMRTPRALELLDMMGLADKVDSKPNQLSGGQQQRVAIARALANDPDILLMDEPTGNLDSVAETEIMDILLSLHRQGKTIIIVTHSNEIAKRAEQVINVKDGQIIPLEQNQNRDKCDV